MNVCEKPKEVSLHQLEGRLFLVQSGYGFQFLCMLCQVGAGEHILIHVRSGNRVGESNDTKNLLRTAVDVTDKYCLQEK